MVHITLYYLFHLSRFLCSAVEDFVIDIVKTWSQIKQNNATIESVILKVSFHSFCLSLCGARCFLLEIVKEKQGGATSKHP